MTRSAGRTGDKTEYDRLVKSAPKSLYRIPDHYGFADGLHLLAFYHLLELLNLATLYLNCALRQDAAGCPESDEEKAKPERRYGLTRMLAYLFTVESDAWRRFCAELPADPEMLLKLLPGYETVNLIADAASLDAFTVEEATAWLRENGNAGAEANTVEATVARMRDFVQSRVEWWG
jgi:hypothetical protein